MSSETESVDNRRQTAHWGTVSLSGLLLLVAGMTVFLIVRNGDSPSVQPERRPVTPFPGPSLNLRLVTNRASAAAIGKAQRAIVFVAAPYSMSGVENGDRFLRGMLSVSQETPAVKAEMYWIVDDSEEWCREWITALGVEGLREVAAPVGHGAIVWMEAGKVVQFQRGPEIQDAPDIRDRTLKLWQSSSGGSRTSPRTGWIRLMNDGSRSAHAAAAPRSR